MAMHCFREAFDLGGSHLAPVHYPPTTGYIYIYVLQQPCAAFRAPSAEAMRFFIFSFALLFVIFVLVASSTSLGPVSEFFYGDSLEATIAFRNGLDPHGDDHGADHGTEGDHSTGDHSTGDHSTEHATQGTDEFSTASCP